MFSSAHPEEDPVQDTSPAQPHPAQQAAKNLHPLASSVPASRQDIPHAPAHVVELKGPADLTCLHPVKRKPPGPSSGSSSAQLGPLPLQTPAWQLQMSPSLPSLVTSRPCTSSMSHVRMYVDSCQDGTTMLLADPRASVYVWVISPSGSGCAVY